MIELTKEQIEALKSPEAAPPRIINPETQETFVLLRIEEFERLKDAYDDSSWTREELQVMAWDVAENTEWEEYDDVPEKS